MKIQAAVPTDPQDDSTRIIVTMSEAEAQIFVDDADPDASCNCPYCAMARTIKSILERLKK